MKTIDGKRYLFIGREAAWYPLGLFVKYYWRRVVRWLWWSSVVVRARYECVDGWNEADTSLPNALYLAYFLRREGCVFVRRGFGVVFERRLV